MLFGLEYSFTHCKSHHASDDQFNWESPAQFENRIKPPVYVRRITRSTMYKKAPLCYPEQA